MPKAHGKQREVRRPLDDVDNAIVREVIARPGLSQREIAKRIGYGVDQVRYRLRNQNLRDKIRAESQRAVEQAVDATAEAILKLKALHTRAVETLGQDLAPSVLPGRGRLLTDRLSEEWAKRGQDWRRVIKQIGKDPEVTEEDVIEAAKFLVQSKGDTPKDEE